MNHVTDESKTLSDGVNELNEQRARRAEAAVHVIMYLMAAAVGATLLVDYLIGLGT
jgi:hypothetical protein